MDNLEPPQHFLFKGNMSHTRKLWLKQFHFYLTATKKDNKDDKINTSMLLTCIGQKGREIYETFTFDSANDEMKLEPVLNAFYEYCYPRKNVIILRHKIVRCRQLEGQSFHDFITELKTLRAECEFENLRDSLIKDMIVSGTNDNVFRERRLKESDLTLSRAISAEHAAEKTRIHAREILPSQSSADLHKISKFRKSCHQASNEKLKEIIRKCIFCNGSHSKEKCLAYGKSCLNCNRKNQTILKFAVHEIEKRYTKSIKSRVTAR